MLVFYVPFVVQVSQGNKSNSYEEQESSKAYFLNGKLSFPGEPAVLIVLYQAHAVSTVDVL